MGSGGSWMLRDDAVAQELTKGLSLCLVSVHEALHVLGVLLREGLGNVSSDLTAEATRMDVIELFKLAGRRTLNIELSSFELAAAQLRETELVCTNGGPESHVMSAELSVLVAQGSGHGLDLGEVIRVLLQLLVQSSAFLVTNTTCLLLEFFHLACLDLLRGLVARASRVDGWAAVIGWSRSRSTRAGIASAVNRLQEGGVHHRGGASESTLHGGLNSGGWT